MSNGPFKGEAAPSRMRADEPTLARYAGGIGWGLVVVGVVGIIANRSFETPRLLVPSEGWGWMFVLLGLTAALVHAAVETDQFLRRALGIVGAALVGGGVAWGIWLAAKEKSWAIGLIPAVPGFFFIALFVRKEEDESLRHRVLLGLGGLGLALAALGVLGTLRYPDHLADRWAATLVVGFILALMHLGIAGVTDQWAQRFAYALIALGAVAIVYALGKSIVASALHDWRSASENQHLIAAAAGLSLLIIGLLVIYVLAKPPEGGEMTDQIRVMKKWG